MNRSISFGSIALALAQICSATPCATGSLASYVSLGSTGCMIGGNTLFDFVVLSSGTAGATLISPADVTITPSSDTSSPGINAAINMTAGSGVLLEAFFTYRIEGEPYVSDAITLAGSTQSGDGAVTYTQNFCAGGTFGPDALTGCTGSPGTLLVLNGEQNQASTSFAPATLLSVTDDFTLDGGLSGSASGGSISDGFIAVPEPADVLLAVTGIALVFVFRSRFTGASSLRRTRART